MMRGVVRFFKQDRGWGAISSPELAEGRDAFVHFSVIQGDGYRSLSAGDVVEFDCEPFRQDGFTYRATRVVNASTAPRPIRPPPASDDPRT